MRSSRVGPELVSTRRHGAAPWWTVALAEPVLRNRDEAVPPAARR
ncbi:MAG: hypothetical protein AVDCRST_MAG49-1362 [uncultured Thermomicrobiales bacterium]|uniref:Uncharacterized protein n=1 Tax=uncultured Thermomicrobiales bacterium TaxID=1645740 RepID=A0A6J4UBY4_9BACT|nr:MAG: hypothetical protein AVDCRST_MAG49-1362 [uncultured Thermomicrobiales bacterium]